MREVAFNQTLDQILAKDRRYDREAYLFVRDALDHTTRAVLKPPRGRERDRLGVKEKHVTGQQLLGGIREVALAQFGPMAMTVLAEWGVRQCSDFGEIVFNMVEAGCLGKSETDSRNDFAGGYDFHEAFRKPFLPVSQAAAGQTGAGPNLGVGRQDSSIEAANPQ